MTGDNYQKFAIKYGHKDESFWLALASLKLVTLAIVFDIPTETEQRQGSS